MPEMHVVSRGNYFSARHHKTAVRVVVDLGVGEWLRKAGPSSTRVKLVFGRKEWRPGRDRVVDTLLLVVEICVDKRPLCPGPICHIKLLRGKLTLVLSRKRTHLR